MDGVESLTKKYQDFDRAVNLQQAKILAIQTSAKQLMNINPPHYALETIDEKANKVAHR